MQFCSLMRSFKDILYSISSVPKIPSVTNCTSKGIGPVFAQQKKVLYYIP